VCPAIAVSGLTSQYNLTTWACATTGKKGEGLPRARKEGTASLPSLAHADGARSSGGLSKHGQVANAKQLISGLNVKAGKGNWQAVQRNEWDVDKPARRAESEGLLYGFQLAMSVLEIARGGDSLMSKGADPAAAGTLTSSLENDLLCIQAQVNRVLWILLPTMWTLDVPILLPLFTLPYLSRLATPWRRGRCCGICLADRWNRRPKPKWPP
jgi:hypothetical protein